MGRLAGAAQRVGAGDLDVQVPEEEGDDEIAMLGRLFNQMTRQLKGQRDALMDNNRQTERRRRLFDSVLSSVTAGVIGLDAVGQVDFINRAAQRLLELPQAGNMSLSTAVPEFAALFARLRETGAAVQEEIRPDPQGPDGEPSRPHEPAAQRERPARRLCGGLRRRDRPRLGAADGRLGRRGAAHRA